MKIIIAFIFVCCVVIISADENYQGNPNNTVVQTESENLTTPDVTVAYIPPSESILPYLYDYLYIPFWILSNTFTLPSGFEDLFQSHKSTNDEVSLESS
ncbi:hypothetical protein PGB90_000919 [Kerria lacca]